jgi:hypothetical protein
MLVAPSNKISATLMHGFSLPNLQVTGRVRYNGYTKDEFVVERTTALVDQVQHVWQSNPSCHATPSHKLQQYHVTHVYGSKCPQHQFSSRPGEGSQPLLMLLGFTLLMCLCCSMIITSQT